jgi:methionine-rich copper-binding protein CopC
MTTMQKWVTAAVLGLLAVVLLPAAPAAAHAKLTGSNPQAGQMITATLPAITLTFSGPVKAELTTIVVAGQDGVNQSTGTPTLADVTLTQPVNPLPPGQITVTWRTVSADGHTINGSFDFTNAAPGATRATPSASATPPAAEPATTAPTGAGDVATEPTSDEGGGSALVWIVIAVVVVAVAAGGTLWYRRRPAPKA